MARFLARGPVTVAGRDYRSGDSFDADADDLVKEMDEGLAEPVADPDAGKAPAARKPKNEG